MAVDLSEAGSSPKRRPAFDRCGMRFEVAPLDCPRTSARAWAIVGQSTEPRRSTLTAHFAPSPFLRLSRSFRGLSSDRYASSHDCRSASRSSLSRCIQERAAAIMLLRSEGRRMPTSVSALSFWLLALSFLAVKSGRPDSQLYALS